MQGVSLTSKAEEEIEKSKSIIDYFFTIEDIIGNEDIRKELFKILKIWTLHLCAMYRGEMIFEFTAENAELEVSFISGSAR